MDTVDFFSKIVKDLHQTVYLALGGSIEDQTFDWVNRGLQVLSVAIKILVLLAFILFWYWILVYITKHTKRWLRLSVRHIKIIRQILRYFCFVACLLAVMTQVGMRGTVINAVAKAAAWAGLYYMALSMNTQVVAWLLRQYDINESIEQLVRNLMLVLILVLASGTILAQFGFDIISLAAGLGIAGLAVGFAAQSTLANFIAGITILVEQSFQVGDWVQVGDKEGRVVKITLRTTHILNRDNIVVIFPNSTVASNEVVNLTSKTFIRFNVLVRVGLNDDVDLARGVILAVLKSHEDVLEHPLSTVTVDHIAEYGIYLTARFWVSPVSVARLPIIKEKITEQIKKQLDCEGLNTPYPHMQVVVDGQPQATKALVLPKE